MSQAEGSFDGEPKDEDVELSPDAELEQNMGAEFSADKAEPLFLSEVSFLLTTVERETKKPMHIEANPVLKKAHEYSKRFDVFLNADTASAVRDQLGQVVPKLHNFEVVQLANLMPESSEEAKIVIPSLAKKYDDDELQDILDGLATLRQT